jgi:hypothetical protein
MAAGLYKSLKPTSRGFPILVKAGDHFFSPGYPLGIRGNKSKMKSHTPFLHHVKAHGQELGFMGLYPTLLGPCKY